MCLSNEQEKSKRAILKGQFKSARDTEATLKFKENILKRRKKIELLQNQSVPNQIYIFPRNTPIDSSSESTEQWCENTEEWIQYDLKTQNKKNKNYQTQTNSLIHARCASTGEAFAFRGDSEPKELLKSQRRLRQDSEGKYFTRKIKEEKESSKKAKMDETNLSNYNSRKGVDKTALNSSKKLIVAEQYSLASQHSKTKKGSQAVTLTCRRKQPPRNRLVTQHS